MNGAADADLAPGEYRIVPSEKMREEYGVPLGDVLSGDFDSVSEAEDGPFHKYDVRGPDGTDALHVFETHGSAAYGWLPFSVPQYVYVLADPEGPARLVVEVDHGWYPSYTVRDPRVGEQVGTVLKSRRLFGDWQLRDPDGATMATAAWTNTGSNLLSFSTHETYDVSGPNGAAVGRFERVRDEEEWARSAMEVSCSRSSVPTEQCLAFAFALFNQGKKRASSSGSSGGP